MSQKRFHDQKQAATSLGHSLSESQYLDSHFATFQTEYEALLRWVGIDSGWHVLDAGCGGGSYLPLLSELVGQTGKITAIDVAPENIDVVKTNAGAGKYLCPVEAQVLSVSQLPFRDRSFDAVWCANVSQYLTDEEFRRALNEFRRVVRPGGLVAIKEFELTLLQIQPMPLSLIWHLLEGSIKVGPLQMAGSLRSIAFHKWYSAAGLTEIRRKTELMERTLPLRDIERSYMSAAMAFFASQAELVGVPADDLSIWSTLTDTELPDHVFQQPDFYWREAQIVVVGRVP